jgi:hypothetical protein
MEQLRIGSIQTANTSLTHCPIQGKQFNNMIKPPTRKYCAVISAIHKHKFNLQFKKMMTSREID